MAAIHLRMLQTTSFAKQLPKILPNYPFPFLSRKMTKAATTNSGPSSSIEDFREVLKSSTRVLALCGAGLSAASGLDTFRGAGGMWQNHRATTLATPEAFSRDPGLVWLFYSYRRHRALQAKPNPGHFALADLAERMKGFVCLTQNVDGLSQRASHPRSSLKLLHGTLFDIKCFNPFCDYIQKDNYDDPIVPALAISSLDDDERLAASKTDVKATAAYLDPNTPTTTIPADQLPHCPKCKTGLLRPGVVWFGEALPEDTLKEVDTFLNEGPISLMLVIGTSATVYPAAGFIDEARAKGARVAVINFDGDNLGAASGLREKDFLFVGDSREILPKILGVE